MQQKDYIELQDELSNLKKEMTGISMVDEFAKYARLQRKCNQLESILKENSKFKYLFLFKSYIYFVLKILFLSIEDQRLSSRLKLQMLLTYIFRTLNVCIISNF